MNQFEEQTIFEDLKKFVTAQEIKPVIGKIFPFDKAGEAHAFIESRRSIGKVLLQHENAEN